MKAKSLFLTSTTLVAAIGSFIWYATVTRTVTAETTLPPIPDIARPVPTALVAPPIAKTVRQFPGTVKAKNEVDLAFSIDGVLVELNGKEGSIIKKGDVIARLDSRDAKNAYEAAKASYRRASADFKRSRSLYKQKVISQAEYDAALANSDVAQAEYNIRAKAVEDTIITAPYDGVISKRHEENHAHIKKQNPVVSFKDISDLEITIQVPERLMANGGINNFSDIQAKFDIDGERWFSGRLKEHSVQSDSVTRTYGVVIQVHPPEDLKVLPGMTATVKASLGSSNPEDQKSGEAVAFIPVESVFSASDGKTYIWQIPEQDGNPQKIEVTLGAMRNNGVEVVSGIMPGKRIAKAGIHSLTKEMKVRPMRDGMEGLDG